MRWFLSGLSALGLAALFCAGVPSSDALAAETSAAPALPPAPYKPLPQGTQVDYDTWSFRVDKSDGFDITFKIDGNRWTHHYAVFGRTGDKAYTLDEDISEDGEEWMATLNGEARSALEGLWPLQRGRTIRYDATEERRGYKGSLEGRDWTVTLEVTGTAVLDLDGKRYATFVVREHGVTEGRQHSFGIGAPLEYVTTLWYHPGSGLVLKALRKWIEGSGQGEADRYKLLRVRYPAGTTNLALKGTPVGTASAPSVAAAPPAEPDKKLTKAPTQRAAVRLPGFLGRDRIEEILVGNTMIFKTKKGDPVFLYFERGGLVIGAYEAEPDRVFRRKWWFKGDDVICRTYGTDRREFCMKIRGGDGGIEIFTLKGAYRYQARVLQGKRLPETSTARNMRAAEIARLKQEAEIQSLKQQAEIARLKQQAEIARLKRAAETPSRPSPPAPARPGAGEDRMERALWSYAKDSRDPADAQAYLERYPGGRFTADARARIKALSELSALKGIDFGNYHALVIGNNDYKHLPDLKTAINDARAVAYLLANEYGFKVSTLINATRADIIEALDGYRESLIENDNLLIYYAGHGWLDEEVNRGYWLPVDARRNRRTNWVSNATISDTLTAVLSKHVMVVADSCFSGTLVRGAGVKLRSGDYWRRMARKRTRVALTSGGLEPVADTGGGGHSPFADAFIKVLKGNTGVIDGTQLFGDLRRRVMVNSDQTPEYSDVRNAGHDGGDFLFVKKF